MDLAETVDRVVKVIRKQEEFFVQILIPVPVQLVPTVLSALPVLRGTSQGPRLRI